MADPLIIVILVAAGGSADATTSATASSMIRTLGPDCRLEVREADAGPTDAEAVAAEKGANAAAVVELIWQDAGHREALLRAHLGQRGRWLERRVGFNASDADLERGRTLGFTAASMLPQTRPGGDGSGATAPSSADVATPQLPGPSRESPPVQPALPVPAIETHEPTTRPGHALAIELVAVVTKGVGGNSDGFGGAGAAHWFAGDRLSLRFGAGGRTGTVDEVQASTFVFFGSAGVAVHPWRATARRPFGLSLRGDYRLERQSVSRTSPDTVGPTAQARWISGFDAFSDVSFLLMPEVEVVIGIGLEDMLAPTYVDLQSAMTSTRVATIPAVRIAAEVGLRWRP